MGRKYGNGRLGMACGVVGVLALAGCANVLGLDEFEDAPVGGAGGGATSAAVTGTGGATASTTTAATSGTGGAGGGGGAMACSPGTTMPCYGGPSGTEGVGLCVAGLATCAEDGSGYGACEGQVVPATDSCATPEDEDCTGASNEGCPCSPGDVAACYGGPGGTENVGLCVGGQQTCEADGSGYGPCVGEVGPAAADDCNALGDEDCDGYACSEPIWAEAFGTSGSVGAVRVAGDATGNVYVTGTFNGTLTVGANNLISAGADDVFLLKLDPQGAVVWAKQFGNAGSQSIGSLAVDSQGNVVLALPLTGTMNLGGVALVEAGGGDIAVAKFDAAGTHLWSARYGDAQNLQQPIAVAMDPAGDVIIAGYFSGTLVMGGSSLASAGADDAFVAKLSGVTGAPSWAKRFGDAGGQSLRALAVDTGGNISFAATNSGVMAFGFQSCDTLVCLARLDTNGVASCSTKISFGIAGSVRGLATNSFGELTVVGDTSSTVTIGGITSTAVGGATDVFVGRVGVNCQAAWVKELGGAVVDSSPAVASDVDDNILLTFLSNGPVDVGGGLLANAGSYDVILAKLDGAGAHLWSRSFGTPAQENGADVASTHGREIILSFGSGTGVDFGTGALPAGLPVALLAP